MKKVVIGLSGGVDSAVAAYLLKKSGYDVEAVFMQNWDSFVNGEQYDNHLDKCDVQYEWEDAQKIAAHLKIKITKIDFIDEYWNFVFKHFLDEYNKGRTPNPDILCNKYIKFGFFLDYALKEIKCDYIATGHYAKVTSKKEVVYLQMAKDKNKDQTYFLCQLNQQQLKHVIFPLHDILKSEVRELAKKIGLPVWDKKDSTGICFIGERNFKQFLKNYLPSQCGDIVDISTKKVIGRHDGTMYYTIGQNNKLGLGGQVEKYYVCKKDVNKSIIYVCSEHDKAKYLTSYKCIVNQFNWINLPKQQDNLKVRFRHRQGLISCNIIIDKDKVTITYPSGAMAVTEGQFAVLYEGENCLGGGQIDVVIN